MTKRLLLVDDEESFLQSLKAGLQHFSDIFETDTCYSVKDAIKNVLARDYDVIVTDLRMPGKSGIDFLVFLKQIKYTGKLMVMSAYNTVDNIRRIRSLGNIDIFSKPFNVEWFKRKLIDFFSKEEEVTFESIDLVTVMQVINLEKKTSAVQIDVDKDKGFIYFEEGEIISAEFRNLRDEAAIREVLNLNKGQITIKKIRNRVKKTIRKPFVELLMELTQRIDELRKDHKETFGKKEEAEVEETKKIKYKTAIKQKLARLREVPGYLAAGVFTPQGELLDGESEVSGIDFKLAGSLVNDTMLNARTMMLEAGFGETRMIQIDTYVGCVFCKCYNDGKRHFHTVLVIKNDGNVAMAKVKLMKTVEELVCEF
ncbi:MAG: response regulator [Candidatus Aminicenantes bacterium]|nr:response regulator [Candidatus Aminicenantes bacterium]